MVMSCRRGIVRARGREGAKMRTCSEHSLYDCSGEEVLCSNSRICLADVLKEARGEYLALSMTPRSLERVLRLDCIVIRFTLSWHVNSARVVEDTES